jgi:hypothetical protein
MFTDLKSEIALVHLKDPADLAHTDTVTQILDTAGFTGAGISVAVGALTGVDSSNYLTPVLQESATVVGTDFTNVVAGDILGAFTKMDTTSKDQVTQFVGYKGTKRYLRVNLDFTGTGITASLVGAVGVLGKPSVFPATGPAAITAT